MDSYWAAMDMKAGYRWSPQWHTELEALNVLDEEYFTPTQTSRIQEGVPNRRREVRLGVLWDY